MDLNRFTGALRDLDTFHFFRDFENFATGTDGLTSLAADAGTSVAAGDARKGMAVLTTGATDNNEAAIKTTNELFLLVAGKPLYGRTEIQYTEANVDDANVFFGFASALAADTLVDNGGGVRTTGNIICIYKIDGGTVWRVTSRNGSAVTDSVSTKTAGGSAAQVLEIVCEDWDGVEMKNVFKVDGDYLKDSNGNVITHRIAIASATEMNLGAYVKAGGANSEVVNVDYLYGAQKR